MLKSQYARVLALILALLLAVSAVSFAEDALVGKGIDVQNKGVVTLNVSQQVDVNLGGRTIKTFKSSKPGVASIDNAGHVCAYAEGKAKITIKFTDKSKLQFTVQVFNPNKPVSVGFAQGGAISLRVGQTATLTPMPSPANATTTYTWKSSKKSIARVDGGGTVTAVKAGTCTVTVTTDNKIKGNITVNVLPNKADNLSSAPTSSQIRSIGSNWTVFLKSVEILPNNKVVLEFYLLNGLGRSNAVIDFYVDLWVNGRQLVNGTVKKSSVKCNRYESKVFKVTFPADALKSPGIDLTACSASAFSFHGINGYLRYRK